VTGYTVKNAPSEVIDTKSTMNAYTNVPIPQEEGGEQDIQIAIIRAREAEAEVAPLILAELRIAP
jgi:hypothetical protein